MAGGYFLAICHDFRTMSSERGTVCLTELRFGGFLTKVLHAAIESKLAPNVALELHMAKTFKAEEAVKKRIVDNVYTGVEEQAA